MTPEVAVGPSKQRRVLAAVTRSPLLLATITAVVAAVVTVLVLAFGTVAVAPVVTGAVSALGIIVQYLSSQRQLDQALREAEAARTAGRSASDRSIKLDLYEEIDASATQLVQWAEVQNGPMPPSKALEGGSYTGPEWPNEAIYGTPPPRLPQRLLRASNEVRQLVTKLENLAASLEMDTASRRLVPHKTQPESLSQVFGERQEITYRLLCGVAAQLVRQLRKELDIDADVRLAFFGSGRPVVMNSEAGEVQLD